MRPILSRILLALYALNIVVSWLHFAVVPHVVDATGHVGHEHRHDQGSEATPDNAFAVLPEHHHDDHADQCRVIEFFSQQTVVVSSPIASALDLSIESVSCSPISRDIVLIHLFHIAPKQSPPLCA